MPRPAPNGHRPRSPCYIGSLSGFPSTGYFRYLGQAQTPRVRGDQRPRGSWRVAAFTRVSVILRSLNQAGAHGIEVDAAVAMRGGAHHSIAYRAFFSRLGPRAEMSITLDDPRPTALTRSFNSLQGASSRMHLAWTSRNLCADLRGRSETLSSTRVAALRPVCASEWSHSDQDIAASGSVGGGARLRLILCAGARMLVGHQMHLLSGN